MAKMTKKEMEEWTENHKNMVKRKNDTYNSAYDRITFMIPKGRKKDIQDYAKNVGEPSASAFISGMVLDVINGRKRLVDVAQDDN